LIQSINPRFDSTEINLPETSGIYILKVVSEEKKSQVFRLIRY
jgi:hypothetical protein